jgi:hypothetical protein
MKSLTRKVFTVAAAATFGLAFVGAALADSDADGQAGAKGLFFRQLEKPSENINTGLRYWIELRRGNAVSHVSSKTQFKTNDSIRFHVKSNIDGYAYILLSSGSRGEQSVLFPDQKVGETNKVTHGKEYVLPNDGYLTFDENPGVEKLTLLLSREPMDAQAYLSKPKEAVTMIASAETGSKDLVPTKIYVSYNAPKADVQLIASQPPVTNPLAHVESKTDVKPVAANDHKAEVKHAKSDTKKSQTPAKVHRSHVSEAPKANLEVAEPKVHHAHHAVANNNPANSGDDEGTVTVVSEESSGILHVDVALQHI